MLTYQNQTSLEVAGIVASPPSNSSIRFDFIVSFSSLRLLPDENELEQYHHDRASLGAYPTYLLLNSTTSAKALETLIPSIANITNERYFLEPFRRGPPNIGYLKIFASIAILVLILALVNYMNLTTGRATTRAKEGGVPYFEGVAGQSVDAQFLSSPLLIQR